MWFSRIHICYYLNTKLGHAMFKLFWRELYDEEMFCLKYVLYCNYFTEHYLCSITNIYYMIQNVFFIWICFDEYALSEM